MSTWFKLPACCMPSEIGGWMEHVNFGVKGLSSHHCEAIEDAINNHDRLTEENAKWREFIEKQMPFLKSVSAQKAQQLLNQLKEQNNDK